MNDRKHELGNESVGRLLVRYSTPAMVAMFVNSLYNLVDTIFVGRGAGTLALAGLAVSFPIQMFILAIAQVVGIGSASLISRSLGAGDARRAERTAGTSFACVATLSAALTGLGLLFLKPLLRLFGATPAVLPYGADYLSVIIGGSFFFAFAVSSNSIVRSEGNAKCAMVSMFIGAITNVILDPIFIFTLKMGVRGAAIATVLANMCAFLYLCRYFLSGRSLLRIRREDLIPDLSVLPEVLRVGSASFTRVAAGSLLAIVLNNSVAHYGSDTHLAIIGVINRVMLFMMMPMFGLVQGLQPIVGFNYGAANYARVREAAYKAVMFATVFSTCSFVILMSFPVSLFRLFNKDAALVTEGAGILRVLILFLPLVGFQVVGASLFQALGKAGAALFLSMSRQILFLVPLLLALPLYFDLAGIWVSFPVADLLSTMVTAGWVLAEFRRLS
jgi:putative MATE family efflux protein